MLLSIRNYLRDNFKSRYDFWKLCALRNPVIVYQMPKTGSQSITRSLRERKQNVFHVHTLNPEFEHWTNYSLARAKLFLPFIKSTNKKINFITCVRDPVARNISDLFQVLNTAQFYRDNGLDHPFHQFVTSEFLAKQPSLENIKEFFLKSYPYHEYPLNWFDRNFNDTLGIDVYQEVFPVNIGALSFKNSNLSILILKLELDDSLKEKYIQDFLSDPEFKLLKTHQTQNEELAYSKFYVPFVKSVKLPPDYVDKMYNSRYTKFFYSGGEIDGFKQKWLE